MKLTTGQLVALCMALIGMAEASTSSASWLGSWWSGAGAADEERRVPRVTKQARRKAEKAERAAAKEALIAASQQSMIWYLLGYETPKPDFSSLKQPKPVSPKRQFKETPAGAAGAPARPGRYVNAKPIGTRQAPAVHHLSKLADLQSINDLFMQLISAPGPNRLRLTHVPQRLLAQQLLKSLAQAYSYHFLQVNPTSVIISRSQAHRGKAGIDKQKVSELIAQDSEAIIEEVVDGLMNVWEGKEGPVVESLSTSESASEEVEAKKAESIQWTTTIHRLPELADLQSINGFFMKLVALSGPNRLHLLDVPKRLMTQESPLKALAQAYGYDFEELGPTTALISKAQEHSGKASVNKQKVSELIAQDFEAVQEELVDGLMKIWEGKVPVVESLSTEAIQEAEVKEAEIVQEATTAVVQEADAIPQEDQVVEQSVEEEEECSVEEAKEELEEVAAPEKEQTYAENLGYEELRQQVEEATATFLAKKHTARAQTLKPRQASKNLPHGSKFRTSTGQWIRHVSNKPASITTEAKRLIQEASMELEEAPVTDASSYDEDASSSHSSSPSA